MDRFENPEAESEVVVSDDLIAARIERWAAQDRSAVLERQLKAVQAELAVRDDRLRRLTDELLHQQDRRRSAEASAQSLTQEIAALRATRWWRLGRLPRWVRSHIR